MKKYYCEQCGLVEKITVRYLGTIEEEIAWNGKDYVFTRYLTENIPREIICPKCKSGVRQLEEEDPQCTPNMIESNIHYGLYKSPKGYWICFHGTKAWAKLTTDDLNHYQEN